MPGRPADDGPAVRPGAPRRRPSVVDIAMRAPLPLRVTYLLFAGALVATFAVMIGHASYGVERVTVGCFGSCAFLVGVVIALDLRGSATFMVDAIAVPSGRRFAIVSVRGQRAFGVCFVLFGILMASTGFAGAFEH